MHSELVANGWTGRITVMKRTYKMTKSERSNRTNQAIQARIRYPTA
eukprot:gene4912-4521_t